MAVRTESQNHANCGSTDQLDLFLLELAETKAKFPDDRNAQQLCKELNQIVERTVMDLSGKYQLFYNAVVQQGGSMAEGTKIKEPDEFDYVLVLPTLQQQLVTMKEGKPFFAEDYDIYKQSTKLPLRMNDPSFMDDILCPEWCDREENEKSRNQQLIFKDSKSPWRDEITAMVSVVIHRSLKTAVERFPNWKYVARLKYPSGRTYLQILKFSNADGLEYFISVDICLAIQIPYNNADSVPLQLLLEFWSINVVSCSRRSESQWETSKFCSLPLDSIEKRCYRLLKYLIQTFLESRFDIYSMTYKTVLETYVLKTMFLKELMESKMNWEPHHLSQKVLEILGSIKQDLSMVKSGESSSDPLKLHPLKVSMDYSLHPVSAEPALFRRSKLSSITRKAASEPIFQRPEAIEDQLSTLIDLLILSNTDEGRQHFLSQIEAIEKLKMLLKDGTYQIPILEILQDQAENTKSGIYNGNLSLWHVLDREDLKLYMRSSSFGIVVQPDGKQDDCIVFPKTFAILKFLNCSLCSTNAEEDDETEIMELDVFDHGDSNQVVCWNVKEAVDLRSIVGGKHCSYCVSRNL